MKELNIHINVRVYTYDELNASDRELIDAAREATFRSYSPYSHFSVGAAAWIDYDNDGCLDLIVAGRMDGNEASTSMTYFFHNEGPSGDYNLVENYDIEDLLPQLSPDGQDCKGIIFAAADFDNDGWTD